MCNWGSGEGWLFLELQEFPRLFFFPPDTLQTPSKIKRYNLKHKKVFYFLKRGKTNRIASRKMEHGRWDIEIEVEIPVWKQSASKRGAEGS